MDHADMCFLAKQWLESVGCGFALLKTLQKTVNFDGA